MFAAIGYIVPEYFKWPGDLSPKLGLKFADIPNGLAAISKAWEVGRDVQHDQSICCDLLSAAYIVYIYYIIYHCNISTLKIYHSQRCSSCPCDSLGTCVIVFCRKVPGQGWAQIVAFLGTYELFINKPAPCLQSANRARNINFAKAFLIS